MNLKKYVSLLLILLLSISLVACTEDPGGSNVQAPAGSTVISGTSDSAEATDSNAPTTNATDSESIGSSEPASTDTEGSGSTSEPDTDDTTQGGLVSTNIQITTNTNTNTNTQKPSTDTGSGSQPADNPWDKEPDTDTPTVSSKPLTAVAANQYYGRTWLSGQQNGKTLVAAYDEIVKGATKLEKEIEFSTPIPESQLETLWYCYREDYPEHFWLGSEYSYTHLKGQIYSVSPSYTMNATQKASAQQQFDSAVTKYLKDLNGDMSAYEREKILHDRLVLGCKYKESSHAHDAYGALVEGIAVCEGYARAFQVLCRKAGIQTLFVQGDSINPGSGKTEPHAWNIVQLNGQYYYVDVTWDDAGEPKDQNEIHYSYFNITTAQLQKDHAIGNLGYTVPNCTATAENYYRKKNAYLQNLTVDGLLGATYRSNGIYYCSVYVENPGNVSTWFNQNLEALGSRMGLGGFQFAMTIVGNEISYTIKPN